VLAKHEHAIGTRPGYSLNNYYAPRAKVASKCTAFAEALTFLQDVEHASGQNFTLSAADRVGAFECSPGSVAEYKARPTAA
jgi:hypothetical protein